MSKDFLSVELFFPVIFSYRYHKLYLTFQFNLAPSGLSPSPLNSTSVVSLTPLGEAMWQGSVDIMFAQIPTFTMGTAKSIMGFKREPSVCTYKSGGETCPTGEYRGTTLPLREGVGGRQRKLFNDTGEMGLSRGWNHYGRCIYLHVCASVIKNNDALRQKSKRMYFVSVF